MTFRRRFETAAGTAQVVFTDRHDGDFHVDGDPARREATARAVVDLPWSWVRQVHGTDVIDVTAPGGESGRDGDALVTCCPGAVLSVRGADCPVVAFISPQGPIGVAHAGWRGLVAGVLQNTVDALRAKGAVEISALLGPCIGVAAYEFGRDELDEIAARLGPSVRGTTAWGTPALDLVAGVRAALEPFGIEVDTAGYRCTASDPALYSHRARAETGRHTAAVWLEPAPS